MNTETLTACRWPRSKTPRIAAVAKLPPKVLAKVNLLRSSLRLAIALHSPSALLETGLRPCTLEKR